MPEGPQSDLSGDALRKRKREHLKGSAVRWSAHCESRSVTLTMGGSLAPFVVVASRTSMYAQEKGRRMSGLEQRKSTHEDG